jgi:DNA polymerase V
MINRNILCIDLKSFFASCECVERGLDPFSYPLVVANKNQGGGAITLAVTPYLKKQGVPSRGRIYEIPKNIYYEQVNPRMKLYIKKSQEVVSIFLDYVDYKDLHIYSIDECFLDVTNYLKMYKKNDLELAKDILKDIYTKTHLTATCGIGPNMLLAKVAMDTDAKHNSNNIAKWSYDDVKTKLWNITPLSEMWGIGKRMEKNLNKLQIYSVRDLALYNPYKLKDKFGIIGYELWCHANGIDNSVISDVKVPLKEKSYGQSQVLFKDYNDKEIRLIIKEMVDVLTMRLRLNHKVCSSISLGITYSKEIGSGFYHNIKLDNPTDSSKEITDICNLIFDKYYDELPIRKVSISCGKIASKVGIQLSLFNDIKTQENTIKINTAIDEVKKRFGKNSILPATSLLDFSTIKARNEKIGGHHE